MFKQLENDKNYNSPWARFFARMIDYAIFGYIVSTLLDYILAYTMSVNSDTRYFSTVLSYISSILSVFLWIFVESYLLTYVGFTPGKFLLNIKLILENNEKFSINKAFKRSILVWIRGMAFGLPLIELFTMAAQYIAVNKNNETSWDNELSITCVCDQKRLIHFIIILSVIIISAISYHLLSTP